MEKRNGRWGGSIHRGNWVIRSGRETPKGWEFSVVSLLLVLPVSLVMAWGVHFADDAYIPLHYAQTLVAGKGLTAFAGDVPPLRSPLWTAVLTLAAVLHLPLTDTALVLSALGWGVTAVLLYQITKRWQNQPILAVLPAFLLALNPIVVHTSGTEIPWLLAAALLAWRVTTRQFAFAVLPLLPLISFAWPTGVIILVLSGLYRLQTRRVLPAAPDNTRAIKPFGSLLLLLLTTTGWAAISWWQFGRLSVDFVVDKSVTAVCLTLLCLLLGWGTAWLMGLLAGRVTVSVGETAVGLALLIGIPIFAAQSTLLWQQARLRPIAYQQLQQQVGQMLRHNTEPDALLVGSAQLGFLAQRSIWRWQGQRGDEATLPRLLTRFVQHPPDIFVSVRSLPWNQLIHTDWFQERYHAIQTFQSAYETRSPFTIWAYQQTVYDQSPVQPVHQVETENGLNLVAYQFSPPAIAPLEAIYVTLYWQTTRPLTNTFNSVVRLISPWDQVAWAQRDLATPRSVPPHWLEPSDWFAERFVLTTTADIPVGGYQLNLSIYEPRSGEFISMYQDGDENALDRILLDYVAVPWRGDIGTAVIPPITFNNQIQLIGYERIGSFQPNATITAKLYWQTLTPPSANYVVFVHLLDENGELIANHDGAPVFGTFPTRAWSPGFTVPDEHPFTLPPNLPPGPYQLKVGLYLPDTGQRLTVIDATGTELEEQAFIVEMIEVQK